MFWDERGTIESIDCPFDVKQVLVARNHKGTLKGLHKSPYPKRVYVSKGCIYDFFGTTECILTQGMFVDVPANQWHGYKCLEDSEIIYLLGGVYDPKVDKRAHWKSPEFSFRYDFEGPHIMSAADKDAPWSNPYTYFIVGDGFLGNQFLKYFPESFISSKRLDDPELVSDIQKSGCTAVICAAGIRGKPNITWCETHEYETLKTNFVDTVAFFSRVKKPVVYFGSGMVYTQPGIYKETDPVEPSGVYSKWRCRLEETIGFFDHVTYLRIMYPASLDGHPQCFFEKMKGRSPHDISVPVTVIPTLFPQIPKLIGIPGIFNFVVDAPIPLTSLTNLPPQDTHESRGNFELDVSKIKDLGLDVSYSHHAAIQ